MIDENRFTFTYPTSSESNPWKLLLESLGDSRTVPIILDDNTAKYILSSDERRAETGWEAIWSAIKQTPKFQIGETLTTKDAAGRPFKLKLVATLSGSVFQSEVLMGAPNFRRLYPAQSGFTIVLVDTSRQKESEVASLLRETLNDDKDLEKSDYSAQIETTASHLAAFQEVENTYLSTFRVLGSLGLMLGTIGLAVVLVRNLLERRAELALLAALGFARQTRTGLVFWENVSLLLLGLLVGAGSALAGVIPNLMTSAHKMNVPALTIALAAVVVIGVGSLLIAVRLMSGRITPAALRAE
jgi:ABC-type antimicrobial peptide transport system permease subunit